MAFLVCRRKNLYITAFAANIAFASAGCCLAWTSPTLPILALPDSFLVVNEEQGSWVGSLMPVGGIFGPLMAGRLLDWIGRKYNLILDILLLLIAWAVLMSAHAVWVLYLGRFLTGVAVGLIFMAVPLYVAEVAENDLRGTLCSFNELFLAAGFLTAYASGPYLSYRNLIFVCIIMPSCFLLIFFWMPESPHYLLAKGRQQDAEKTLRWLRGGVPEDCIEKELIEIQELLNNSKDQLSLWKIGKTKGGSQALFITCGLIFFQQFTGINAIQFYTQQIFKKATEKISPTMSSILLGAVQGLSSAFTPYVVNQWGLKIPLLTSAIGMSISHFLLGLYYFLDYSGSDVSDIIWLPIASLVAFTFFFCYAFGPLPWAVMGEMFPPNMKAMSSAAVSSFCFSLMFVITKFFSNLTSFLGSHSAFWLFSLTCFIGFFFTYKYLPDTKGMSLQQIQDLLNGQLRERKTENTNDNEYELTLQTVTLTSDGKNDKDFVTTSIIL